MMCEQDKCYKFAILLAAHNGRKYIFDQLFSVLNQVEVSVHIFISVDLSTDSTFELLDHFSRYETRITLLDYGEKFGSAAPNFYRLFNDIDFSTFDYIALSDQDDVWATTKLVTAQHELLFSNSDGYSSDLTAFWNSDRQEYIKKSYPQKRYDYLFESAGPGCTFVLTNKLAIGFQALLRSGPLPIDIHYHDWLIYAFARKSNMNWVIHEWSSIGYRQHDNNQLGVNKGFSALLYRFKLIINGYGFNQSLLIANFLSISKMNIVSKGILNGRFGYLWLSLRSVHCRRRLIDVSFFFISCLLLFVFNPKYLKK